MIDAAVIEREALKLDLKSRGRLVSLLLRSLENNSEEDEQLSQKEIDELWLVEIERRRSEMDSEEVVGIPLDKVLSELRDLRATLK